MNAWPDEGSRKALPTNGAGPQGGVLPPADAGPQPGAWIACQDLVKIYHLSGVEILALQGLELAVQRGEMLGIVGASGSGKTTLLNILGGLDRPTAGKVFVAGRNLLDLSEAGIDTYRREQVGFVWQQTTRNLLPYLTALENVELPLRLADLSARHRRERAAELLADLGLEARRDHYPAQLSGGEQQRNAIAVALANHPAVLLADEPTGELDSTTAVGIYTALRRMNERYAMTILIVSHDPDLQRYTDRVVAIRDGKTSTETVRLSRLAGGDEPPATDLERGRRASESIDFEELVVLDSAGRLQIPREYLDALRIGDRVRLELQNGRILIQPVADRALPPDRSEALSGGSGTGSPRSNATLPGFLRQLWQVWRQEMR